MKADLFVFVVLLPFGHKYAAGLKVKARWQKHLRSEVSQQLRHQLSLGTESPHRGYILGTLSFLFFFFFCQIDPRAVFLRCCCCC